MGYPFAHALRAAVINYGWSTSAFWQATPKELAALAAQFFSSNATPTKAQLRELLRRYPDDTSQPPPSEDK
ncbi:phage tail assembly chaperone [Polycladidibacter hongkongensis]|uniref:phage tail assembly chaperone n=1 Tax=Polycladidibacter hongkongensis TaxID=1647556 RepID=UPI0008326C8B|nr:phage tail assembly chaperone [Pseudovibrio hongkongensis]